jgi:putative tryptophan/tyrosine transport system substrate-binding protein
MGSISAGKRPRFPIGWRKLAALLGVGLAACCPFAARAQEKSFPVVGFLHATVPGPTIAMFNAGLAEGGYIEGQNVRIEYRWAEGRYDRLPAFAADLVARKVDVIATGGGTPAARAAKNATLSVPIVFVAVGDPVGIGLVRSLARPGGNLTGVSFLAPELLPKRLEILSDLVPQARSVAALINPNNPANDPVVPDLERAARSRGVLLHILRATSEPEIEDAFARVLELRVGALLVGADPYFVSRREQFAALASRYGVPAFYAEREFVEAGGLISYAPSLAALYRQGGIYVGKILKGAKPADLPVEQPTRFELVINLKTAKALGLSVPQSILAGATDVIE